MSSRYFIIHKPFGVLSQFTREVEEHVSLREAFPGLPSDVYPVGRLDRDSEGLLLITNDKQIIQKILHPKSGIKKTYWVQVEGVFSSVAKAELEKGVSIRVNKKDHHTLPCTVKVFTTPPVVAERVPPIRFRQNVPTSWVSIAITEGKNRQVRKMCAKVGFPVLRLIRHSIGGLELNDLKPGKIRELKRDVFAQKLKI